MSQQKVTQSVIGGRERPAISSRELAPIYPDKSHAHLLTKMRNAFVNMDPAFLADNVRIIHLKGPAKRWSEVHLTEAGAYKFLEEYEDSPYPTLKKFAADARPVVAAHFTDAGPDKWAAEVDALKAENVRLSNDLAQARDILAGITEDRDAYQIAADEWKAKWEKSEKEAEARAEFDRARILGLEATVSDLEEKLHIGCDCHEIEEDEPAEPRRNCVDCVPRIEAEINEEDAREVRYERATQAITDHLIAHGMPSMPAAVVAVAAIRGLGDGGLAATFKWLAKH